jgi:iron(III) transport system substrate-binding protein
MKHPWISWICTACVFAAFAALPSFTFAAADSVADIALYSAPDRQTMLEAGARREGALLIYATGAHDDPLYDAFTKKYPFIKLQAFRADAPMVTSRMIEEYGAGTYSADVIDLNVAGTRQMEDSGLLQSYRSPEHSVYRPEAIEPHNYWTIDYESYLGLGFNTKIITAEEAPHSYDDLLDPKWKGRMSVPGSSTLANFVGAMVLDKGEDFVRRLKDQRMRAYQVSARAVANLVVSGEVPLSPAMFNSHMAESKSHGADVAWRPLGGVFATTGALALAARAPHPHAAMLYIDFILSYEGQTISRALGYKSARTDFEDSETPTRVYYFSDAPDYQANYEKWLALGRAIVGE